MSDDLESVEGFGKLIETVGELYGRPRRRCRYEDTPPILGCVLAAESAAGQDEQPDPRPAKELIESIEARLKSRDGRPQVPYAKWVLPAEKVQSPADAELAELEADDVIELQDVLGVIADELAKGNGGSYRFPRFWLATWLMSQEVPGKNVKIRRRLLRDRLYQRSITRASHGGTEIGDLKADLPVWARLFWVILLPLYFWARHSGKVPGIGRTYRWFIQQTDVAPGNDSFFELALRLTKHQWTGEKSEQVARLLVNAFLEDLRDDFRGAGWINRYHTTFPTVLLGRISRRNGGYTLLRMVAEVRNDLRIFDPLLLITTGNRVPPLAKPPQESSRPTTVRRTCSKPGAIAGRTRAGSGRSRPGSSPSRSGRRPSSRSSQGRPATVPLKFAKGRFAFCGTGPRPGRPSPRLSKPLPHQPSRAARRVRSTSNAYRVPGGARVAAGR